MMFLLMMNVNGILSIVFDNAEEHVIVADQQFESLK